MTNGVQEGQLTSHTDPVSARHILAIAGTLLPDMTRSNTHSPEQKVLTQHTALPCPLAVLSRGCNWHGTALSLESTRYCSTQPPFTPLPPRTRCTQPARKGPCFTTTDSLKAATIQPGCIEQQHTCKLYQNSGRAVHSRTQILVNRYTIPVQYIYNATYNIHRKPFQTQLGLPSHTYSSFPHTQFPNQQRRLQDRPFIALQMAATKLAPVPDFHTYKSQMHVTHDTHKQHPVPCMSMGAAPIADGKVAPCATKPPCKSR
jgi:hypothetical protein